MRVVRRIHIVGGPASGKTTLARSLGTELGVKVYDLDDIAYEDSGTSANTRPLEARIAFARSVAAEPAWITEGIYLWWTDELLRTADVIIWLMVRWRVAARRTVSRHIRRSLAGGYPHAGIRNLMYHSCFVRRYYWARVAPEPKSPDDDRATTQAATAGQLAQFRDKVLRWRDPGDIEGLLATIRNS